MKKFLKVVLGIIAVVVLGIAAIFYFIADMVKVADGFFDAVKSRDISKAYSYLSDDFKANTSQVFFRQEYVYEGLGWKLLGLKVQIK